MSSIKRSDVAELPRNSGPSKSLPEELVQEIVGLVCDGYAPSKQERAWMLNLATVSRTWLIPIRKALFRRLVLLNSPAQDSSDSTRLRSIVGHGYLAAYVAEIEVSSRVLQAPDMHALLGSLPRVTSLTVRRVNASSARPRLAELLSMFPRLLHLGFQKYWAGSVTLGPLAIALSSLELSGGAMKLGLIDLFASSPSRETLRAARLKRFNLSSATFSPCISALSRFTNLHTLELGIYACVTSLYEVLDTDISFGSHPHLVSLSLHMTMATPHAVPILRALFASAAVPALRHLELELTLRSGWAANESPFMSFDAETLARTTPILPAAIANALESLRFRITNQSLNGTGGTALSSLFGLQSQSGVLQVAEGDPTLL